MQGTRIATLQHQRVSDELGSVQELDSKGYMTTFK